MLLPLALSYSTMKVMGESLQKSTDGPETNTLHTHSPGTNTLHTDGSGTDAPETHTHTHTHFTHSVLCIFSMAKNATYL